jgi:cytochrome bd-type quinol oxidase subunit 2
MFLVIALVLYVFEISPLTPKFLLWLLLVLAGFLLYIGLPLFFKTERNIPKKKITKSWSLFFIIILIAAIAAIVANFNAYITIVNKELINFNLLIIFIVVLLLMILINTIIYVYNRSEPKVETLKLTLIETYCNALDSSSLNPEHRKG